jgi:hypothetical protein
MNGYDDIVDSDFASRTARRLIDEQRPEAEKWRLSFCSLAVELTEQSRATHPFDAPSLSAGLPADDHHGGLPAIVRPLPDRTTVHMADAFASKYLVILPVSRERESSLS